MCCPNITRFRALVVIYLPVAVILFTAALLAIDQPARRVSRIDSMVVLRTEGS